ncbi:hypothetical conserved protein [Oceanobacillus iheyensis HTE831]|uniref:Hypothetical conserved protein n=1 Tax=Oceanobacillus iheyensis (strain DSM 14371 / CIP 107618 / JCM 11309 / KCTC 3954 / HTE831) TaxID=221109 RepID=Q8ERI7_OCEIH|nr:type VII secretion protein EssB [Oceanobacillus iheyensis]BAC13271.1 hypothetical conserved protein [Oceanobacillus iheyensis HTE831]
MDEKTIEIDNFTYTFKQDKNTVRTSLPISQTRMKNLRQLDLMLQPSEFLVPLEIKEEEDTIHFDYKLHPKRKSWTKIQKLNHNEKLRILCNLGKLDRFLTSRITFFIHPDNVVFDDNYLPSIIHRGIRDVVPPFDMQEEAFLKQYKCFIIALFSKKYNFEQLYYGSLEKANETEFEKKVQQLTSMEALKEFLIESYEIEQEKTEKTMSFVPTKRFRLYKQLSIIMIIVSVLLAAPLIYYALINHPFQDKQLDAYGEFLGDNYNGVITTLSDENPENFPSQTKYMLAYSYIQVESLPDEQKNSILNNVSLNSNQDYLLYWIYNGRGNFEESLEKAKYIDDPQLIIHGLIQNRDQVRNNPDLSGTERDEELNQLQDELDRYLEEYELDPFNEEEQNEPASGEGTGNSDLGTSSEDESTNNNTDDNAEANSDSNEEESNNNEDEE